MTKQDLIRAAKLAYYNTDTPVMTDEQYDRLVVEVGEETVGAPVLDSMKKIKIKGKPMLSLNKCHSEEEVMKFANEYDLIASIKCDGLSCRLIYEGGVLISANTRGDGEIGQDITEHARHFKNIPILIECTDRVVVDGEAIIFQEDFDEINKNGEFKNPRNLAAGTLASLDTSLCKYRRMSFIAWDLIEPEVKLYNEGLNFLEECHFTVVPWQYTLYSNDSFTYKNINNKIFKIAEEKGIPNDGVVWRINDNKYGESLGRTSHHFLNGLAYKKPMDEVLTELLHIDYEVSRKGILTPVAVFKPIELEGTTVERASLYNYSEMKKILGSYPDLHQPIYIIKCNQIIPKVTRAEYINNDIHDHIIFDINNCRCPICGSLAKIAVSDSGVETLVCPNSDCEGKIAKKMEHYCSRDKGMDIRGLSLKTIEKLLDWGYINEIKDIYNLKTFSKEWTNQTGFGEKSVNNILEAIENSKHTTLEQFISSIGIPLIGRTVAKEIVKYYNTWNDFKAAVGGRWSDLDGFGIEMEKALNSFDYSEADFIAENYLEFLESQTNKETSTVAAELNLCVTGKLGDIWNKRDDLIAFVESKGGKVSTSVSGKTTHLVNNDANSTSSKNIKAKQLNIPIITEKELMEMLK